MRCLVRKLGVVIENSELPYFNTKVFSASKNVTNETLAISMLSGSNCEIKYSGGVTIKDKSGNIVSNPYNLTTNPNDLLTVDVSSEGGNIIFTEFDKINYFTFRWALNWVEVVEFAECLSLTTLGISGANLRGEVRDFAEKQIEYGRASGKVNVVGQDLTIDGVSGKLSATVTYNSKTSYSIDGVTWILSNGAWIKS